MSSPEERERQEHDREVAEANRRRQQRIGDVPTEAEQEAAAKEAEAAKSEGEVPQQQTSK